MVRQKCRIQHLHFDQAPGLLSRLGGLSIALEAICLLKASLDEVDHCQNKERPHLDG